MATEWVLAGASVLAAAGSMYAARSAHKTAERRLEREFLTQDRAITQIERHLHDETFSRGRSFDKIREAIGGFTDDELRRMLVAAGAERYTGQKGSNKGREMWRRAK